ncbi:MAG: hypothetical protein Q4A33_02130 [Candidatus Saccharibacteria bacterium]|nr:hypothetical protein [Candidatus Saccharibacteria bacterium]
MGKGPKWEQVRKISQKYVTPEAEIRKMMNSGMSNAAVIKALQERWKKEELDIDRLGVILKHYAPVSIYGDKEKSKKVIGYILNARRNGDGNELSDMMLAKLKKAKQTEAALVLAVKVPVFLALIVICFAFLNMYWGLAATALFVAYCIISIVHPRSFFPKRLKTFNSIIERMHSEELAECKKKKAENEKADVYMPVIKSDCTLGRSYSF